MLSSKCKKIEHLTCSTVHSEGCVVSTTVLLPRCLLVSQCGSNPRRSMYPKISCVGAAAALFSGSKEAVLSNNYLPIFLVLTLQLCSRVQLPPFSSTRMSCAATCSLTCCPAMSCTCRWLPSSTTCPRALRICRSPSRRMHRWLSQPQSRCCPSTCSSRRPVRPA